MLGQQLLEQRHVRIGRQRAFVDLAIAGPVIKKCVEGVELRQLLLSVSLRLGLNRRIGRVPVDENFGDAPIAEVTVHRIFDLERRSRWIGVRRGADAEDRAACQDGTRECKRRCQR